MKIQELEVLKPYRITKSSSDGTFFVELDRLVLLLILIQFISGHINWNFRTVKPTGLRDTYWKRYNRKGISLEEGGN